MIQISSKLIENILSHRISSDKDKYEYQCKMSDSDNPIWLSEDYVSKNGLKMLETFKQKAGLIQISNVSPQTLENNNNDEKENDDDKEFDMMDFAKFIALDFNESFGIKLEVGLEYNEFEIETPEEVPEISSTVKIKSENVEYEEVSNLVNEIEKVNHEKTSLIDTNKSTNGDSCKEIDNQIPKKSGKNIERNNVEKETNRDIEMPEVTTHLDPVVRLFEELPIASKIEIDMRDISKSQLPKISADILRSIAEKGSFDVLQNYMLSDQRDQLQRIVQTKTSNLVIAAKNNFLQLVSSFLSLGAKINGVDQHSKTALMYACENENEDLIDLLVNNGASMNITKNRKHSILYICCQENKPKSVKTLLKLGADFTRIHLEPSYSLIEYAKKMKLNDISRIAENHLSSITNAIKNIIMPLVGSKIKIFRIIPICVLSPIEFPEEYINCSFAFDLSQQSNHFTMCFFLTGIILGSEMKCVFSEGHRITSVLLNDVEQISFTAGSFKTITAFSSLQSQNSLKITGENLKCRKTRLIVTACTVEISE